MASLALEWLSIRCRLTHELSESSFVGVGVATCASEVLPVIDNCFRFEICGCLMTIAARNRHMTSAQSKRCFVVPAQAECRWQKSLQIVAMLAAIEVWRGGELPGMLIPMAVRAVLKLHLVDRGFAPRNVTLRARQCGMLTLERIRRHRVFLDSELSRFEAVDVVAGRAFISTCALGKLSPVRIRAVTICTLLKYQCSSEISSGVALHTFHLGVPAKKRKSRLGMVKSAIQCRRRKLLPASRAVTGLTGL